MSLAFMSRHSAKTIINQFKLQSILMITEIIFNMRYDRLKYYKGLFALVNWSRIWVRSDGVPGVRVRRCWWWLDRQETEVVTFHSTELELM